MRGRTRARAPARVRIRPAWTQAAARTELQELAMGFRRLVRRHPRRPQSCRRSTDRRFRRFRRSRRLKQLARHADDWIGASLASILELSMAHQQSADSGKSMKEKSPTNGSGRTPLKLGKDNDYVYNDELRRLQIELVKLQERIR